MNKSRGDAFIKNVYKTPGGSAQNSLDYLGILSSPCHKYKAAIEQ